MTYATIAQAGAARVAADVPAAARAAASPTSSRRRRCGTWTSRPPSPRPSSRTASSPAPITASASPGRGRRRRCEIETTRPELLPACVALVAHPDDERYQPLFGTRRDRRRCSARACRCWRIALADPEKGSGIAMICTFGDITDVIWWRELKLPVRAVIQPNGTLGPVTWGAPGLGVGRSRRAAQAAYDQLAGLSAKKAQAEVVELLRESGDLLGEPRPITHHVKFYEKGDRPLEIVTSRQWFIKTIEYREELLARGRELAVASRRTCGRATRTGSTASTATGASAGSASSACRSRCGIRVRADGSVDYARPSAARRGAAADRSVDRRARRLHRGPARPARRLRRRSRRDGHLGDLVGQRRRS